MMIADASGGCLVLVLALLGILGIAFSGCDANNSAENKRINERMKRHARSVRD